MTRAIAEHPAIAYIGISVTSAGAVDVSAMGIEPEHAEAMLPDLDRLRSMLEDLTQRPRLNTQAAPVIHLRA